LTLAAQRRQACKAEHSRSLKIHLGVDHTQFDDNHREYARPQIAWSATDVSSPSSFGHDLVGSISEWQAANHAAHVDGLLAVKYGDSSIRSVLGAVDEHLWAVD